MTQDRKPGVLQRRAIAALATLAMLMIGVSGVQAKHVRVGMLWDEFGGSGEEAWGGTCMVWPGGFWKEDLGGEDYAKASGSYKGFLYGFQNFTVPDQDLSWAMTVDVPPLTVMPYYVVDRDIKNTPPANGYQLIPGVAKVYYRSNPAVVTTDGVVNNPPETADGPEDPTMPADVKLVSQWRNNAGVQTTRTIYAFANANHDDYHIWHYHFENTGKYCCGRSITVGDTSAYFSQTLHNFRHSHSFWFMDRAEGGRRTGTCCESTGDNLNNYKGHQVTSPYAPADVLSDTKVIVGQKYGMNLGTAKNYGDLRVQYAWDGDASNVIGEDSGDPDKITGRMLSPRWPGVALIHADKSVTDRSDDPDQPQRSDYDNHNRMPQINQQDLPGAYEFLYKTMSPSGPLVAGGLNNRFQQDAIREGVPYSYGAPNPKFTGSETILAVGNWELPPGEALNVIWVCAVGGIPYQETVELGNRLRLPTSDPNVLTEEARLTKYFSLEDSLFTILRRAQDMITRNVSSTADLEARLNSQLSSISSPPNAATFTVNSGVGKISMTWTAPTTRTSEVAKYRVYRARGSRVGDFPWGMVYEGTGTSFDDVGVSVGIQYFYYLVTVNAAGVESSPHMARTERGVTPSTAVATAVTDENVYVVPNPYDARYQLSTFAAQKGQPLPAFAGQVLFYGLPAKATIHIYTLDGVEIRTIQHDVQAGTEAWDLTSATGQPVVTGVYIYVVDSSAGKAIGKLVIVR